MLGVCLTWPQTYGQEWSIGYLWSYLDWISRLDILFLAVMLAYVVVVARRGSYQYRLACAQVHDLSHALPWSRPQRALIADLSRGVRTLQSIAFSAPYLGLAGTCFGILESFRGVGMQKAAAMAMITTYIAASLLTTASGLVVALSAASSYNYLLWLIGKLESELVTTCEFRCKDRPPCFRIFSKYPLGRQFSKLPGFALIAAPGLAVVLAAFTSFSSFRGPVGLELRLLQPGDLAASKAAPVQPLFIELSEMSAGEKPDIYLNSKRTTWDDLDSSLRNNLKIRPQPTVYVEADDDVQWANVALVIDSVKADSDDVIILLTIAPEVSSGHARRSGKSRK
jgi:biopolymer transport protein ExbD